MGKPVDSDQIYAVIDALILTDKKNKKIDKYTPDSNGLQWSDRQRKYFLMTGAQDPCVEQPSQSITVRAGESEISLTLPKIAEGYEEQFRRLLKITLKFICQQNAFGPCHPSNLDQLAWVLSKADTD